MPSRQLGLYLRLQKKTRCVRPLRLRCRARRPFGQPILHSVFFDYDDDTVMAERRGKFLSLTNQEGLLFMRQRGYEHVQKMAEEGKLDCIQEVALAAPENAAG